MNIGQLRHKVRFDRATEAQNAVGEPVPTWAEITSTRARIEPTGGNEKYAAMQVQGETLVRIVCRYQSDLATLTIKDRVVHGSNVYDIKSVINTNQRNRQLEIFAKLHG